MRKLKLDELGRLSPEEFRKAKKTPFVVVLNNVRSLNNVGSAFRTADAFLVEKIILSGISGQPPHREIQKTALGATESVAWEYKKEVLPIIKDLKSKGYRVLSVEQTDKSIPLQKVQLKKDEPAVIIFGNEVSGVEMDLIHLSDQIIEIPQLGTKHSFNISVSIGIVLWELANRAGYIN